jgi:4,5-dihydroxyphthalate decarboxylase
MGRIVGGDPLPYGIEANRASIEAMLCYCHQQGLLKKSYAIGDMFVDPRA